MAFLYETRFLDLEVYRLVTILEASHALAEFEGSETDQNQVDFLRGFEFPEVSRIVVTFAAIIRSAIDADPRGYSTPPYGQVLERAVGTLVPDETKPHLKEPLRFREACNKVLHADQVDLVRAPDTAALTGELELYGSQRGKHWLASLDLKEYALSALYLTP